MRPKHLAIRLSKLTPHPCRDVTLEQYATEGDLAAYWMLAVDQLDGLEGKVVADLGAGNGILGIGALFLGARRVVFVETDEDALEVLRSNVASLGHELAQRAEVIAARVGVDDLPIDDVDLVVMNPPWGVQRERADRPFLEAAFNSAGLAVHLLHSDRASHVEAVAASHDWEAEAVLRTEFRLPPTYEHHAKRTGTTDVQCWRFHRTGDARLPQETDE
jgi:putative methylase